MLASSDAGRGHHSLTVRSQTPMFPLSRRRHLTFAPFHHESRTGPRLGTGTRSTARPSGTTTSSFKHFFCQCARSTGIQPIGKLLRIPPVRRYPFHYVDTHDARESKHVATLLSLCPVEYDFLSFGSGGDKWNRKGRQ